jgi:hypothetical protein
MAMTPPSGVHISTDLQTVVSCHSQYKDLINTRLHKTTNFEDPGCDLSQDLYILVNSYVE